MWSNLLTSIKPTDINIGYHVVELDNYTPKHFYSDRDIGIVRTKLYRLDRAPPSRFKQSLNEIQIESGTNRKGYFVKQKRKRGKKGVKNYNDNTERNNNDSGSDSNSNSSGSGSDSEQEAESGQGTETFKPHTIYVVQKKIKLPEMIRSGPFHGCTCTRTCHCGKELGTRRRREAEQQISSLDLSAL